MTKSFFFFLFFICCLQVTAQNQNEADSIKAILDASTVGSAHYFEAFNDLLNYYETNLQQEELNAAAALMIEKAIQFNQPSYQADALIQQSRIAERKGNYDKALQLNLEALKQTERGEDEVTQTVVLGKIALLYFYADNETAAKEFIEQAISLSKKIKHTVRLSVSYYYKGYIYLNIYQNKIKENPNNRDFFQSLLLESEKGFDKALSLAKSIEHKGLIVSVLQEMTGLYLELKRTNEAIAITKELMKSKTNSYYYLNYYRLAVAYQSLKKYPLAESYLDTAIQLVTKNGIVDELKDFTELKYEWAAERKDYKNALKHYQQWIEIKDSLWTAEKQLAFDELSVTYETEKKEQQNLILTNQKIALETRNKWISATAILSLLGLSIIVFFFYKLRKQNTVIDHQKNSLSQSLQEKEVLLKEIHHRVKNNLQIISNLMAKQARKTTDNTVKKMMQEGQDRVQSMALIHQNLYQSDNISEIDMKAYLEELTENIARTQTVAGKKITVQLSVDDSKLDIDTAIPLGLILNEVITNTYKYAFVNMDSGAISIVFQQTNDQQSLLQVKDNGIGLPKDFNIKKTKSLGLNLVQGLVQQLDGTMRLSGEAGTEFELVF